jgi:hypothetical protein
MGREAQCFCRWGASKGSVKAHLETRELIIRGDFRKRILLDQISHISVAKDDLCFKAGGEEVSLSLGAPMAEKWAKALTSPPPTLAKKLGIKSASRVYFWGKIDDHELANAVRSSLVKEAQIIHPEKNKQVRRQPGFMGSLSQRPKERIKRVRGSEKIVGKWFCRYQSRRRF